MAAFTIDQFIAIEGAVDTAANMIAMTGDTKLRDNMRSAQYLMSVIRSHAQTYANATPDQDNAEISLSLLSALYR